jgi:hypothetical protein
MNDAAGEKRFIFAGTGGNWRESSFVDAVQNIIFLFGIWQCKINRKVPNFTTVENNMLTIFDSTVNMSVYLSEIAGSGTSSICRLWRHRSGRG